MDFIKKLKDQISKNEHLANRKLAAVAAVVVLVGVSAIALELHGSDFVSGQPRPTMNLLKGQWSYMPGVSREGNGLKIDDLGFKIVEQDGSGGQPNPPVNLSGTHLKVRNSFEINAQLNDIQGDASLQLDGKVPIIQDEFRVEPPGLSVEVKPGKKEIEAKIWDGSIRPNLSNPQPVLDKTYEYGGSKNANLSITRDLGRVILKVNNRTLGSLPEHGVFISGEAWFGASSKGGSWKLTSLVAKPLDSGKVEAIDSSKLTVRTDAEGLQKLASRRRTDFKVGAAMALAPMVSDPEYSQTALSGNFGSMTTENALKMQFVEPRPDVFDYHEADALVDMARRHDLIVHGHTLVFSEANPRWVQNLPINTPEQKKRVEEVMLDYISKTIRRYDGSTGSKGLISSWDVVDEPLGENNQLRRNIWYKAMGPGYIAKALGAAHAANPSAKLYINEYGLEMDDERWQAMLTLLDNLQAQKVPIDGVGFEAHVYEKGDEITPSVLQKRFKDLDARNLKYRISEMDVYGDGGLANQADQYKAVFEACFKNSNCVSFTTWGVSDRYDMWQDDQHQLRYGQDFLWDKRMDPTPAEQSIKGFLDNQWLSIS